MIIRAHWNRLAVGCPYCAFFLVGSVIGLTALVVREVLDALGPADSPAFYAVTVSSVNALGVVTAFFAHRRFTFQLPADAGRQRGTLKRFVLISLLGIGVSSVMALVLRYGLRMDQWLGPFAPAAAFAAALIVASGVTYRLNAKWNFSDFSTAPGHPDNRFRRGT